MAPSTDEILQRVYDIFRASGEWPSVLELQREFKGQGDFRTIAARIGRDTIVCQDGPTGRCFLPLTAIAARQHCQGDVDLFCAAIRLAAKSYAERGAEPLTQGTFAKELDVHGAALPRLGRLLHLENFVFAGGASSNANMSTFSLTPAERAIHFDGVGTFADYQAVVRRITAEERERSLLHAAPVGRAFDNDSHLAEDETFGTGDYFHSRQRLYHVLATAATDVLVVDQYLDPAVLDFVDALPVSVAARLLTGVPKSLFVKQLRFLQQNRSQVEARSNTASHDRWVVIDSTSVWHLGASINGLGKAACRISRLSDPTQVAKVLTDTDQWWKTGALV